MRRTLNAATREWIAGLREHAAVIVSTHLLGDVRACCDEVAVLHEGAIAFSGCVLVIPRTRPLVPRNKKVQDSPPIRLARGFTPV